MPSDPIQRALARLRADPSRADALAAMLVEETLARPVREIVDPGWLAAAVADGIRQAAASDELEGWVRSRLSETLSRADRVTGTLADHLPVTLLGPLETALGRDLTLDPRLVAALIDHPSLRDLVAAMLQESLLDFGQRLRSLVPDGAALPGARLRSRLAEVTRGVAGAVSGELERQLEQRVRTYVDGALGRAIDLAVERFSSPRWAPEMARWRVDVLHALLQHPLEELVAERHKYPPELFAADLTALLRALASWRRLGEALQVGLEQAFQQVGDQAVRDWLAGSGLEETWRPKLEVLLARRLREVVATEAFARFFAALADEP